MPHPRRLRRVPSRFVLIAAATLAAAGAFAQEKGAPVPAPVPAPLETFNVWPGEAPGETGDIGPEYMLVERRRPFYQITNVTTPTVSAYLPEADEATGASILVMPGGGLARLTMEHEGFEVAEWLQENGIAAFVLKYRVPPRGEDRSQRYKAGLQDAQRAMSLIRSRAAEWKIDPAGIGAIGFSAGAEIGVLLSLFDGERQYETVDDADKQSTKPAFMINIYPGGLAFGRPEPAVREVITSRINDKMPPMFFAHAFSDASLNSILMTLELKKAGVPAELHVFHHGAHGFGARESGLQLNLWRDLALGWMGSLGFLDAPHVRAYPTLFSEAREAGSKLPRISELNSDATIEDAYNSQRRLVAWALATEKVAGYKGAATNRAAQSQLGVYDPLHCVLFQSGVLQDERRDSLALSETGPMMIETEIGYVIAVDISSKIEDPAEAQTASQAIVPVIELPADFAGSVNGDLTGADIVAANCGPGTRIVVGPRSHPDGVDPDAAKISLSRDGKALHRTTGASVEGGQWTNLMTLINQVIEEGGTIREGDIIISGSIGPAHPAEPGLYTADYGALGKIGLRIE